MSNTSTNLTLTLDGSADYEILKVLAVLLPHAGQTDSGTTEDKIVKECGLDNENKTRMYLAKLIEEGLVHSELRSVGAAGDTFHHYKLIGKCSVTVVMEIKEVK